MTRRAMIYRAKWIPMVPGSKCLFQEGSRCMTSFLRRQKEVKTAPNREAQIMQRRQGLRRRVRLKPENRVLKSFILKENSLPNAKKCMMVQAQKPNKKAPMGSIMYSITFRETCSSREEIQKKKKSQQNMKIEAVATSIEKCRLRVNATVLLNSADQPENPPDCIHHTDTKPKTRRAVESRFRLI